MIERIIKNEVILMRWREFKSIKRAYISLWIFAALIILSATSEFWANSKPIIMSYKSSVYIPVIKKYHPTVFNQTETLVTDYRAIDTDWALWPPIKWDPFESNKEVDTYPSGLSETNIFGTDDRGRDVAARLLYGFRYSIGFALLVWFLSYTIGSLVGALMGYLGGWVDLLGQRVVEVFETVPVLMILITLVSIFEASMGMLVVIVSVFGWMMISYYIRAEFLKLRNRDFVEAAKALGGSRMRVIFKHIFPNALGPIITFSPFTIAGLVSSLAILDYLGFGLAPPTPSWGELLQQAHKNFLTAWWLALFPSLALFLTLVVLNLIGEGVREAVDPR